MKILCNKCDGELTMPPMIVSSLEKWQRNHIKECVMRCHHCKSKVRFKPEDFYRVFRQVLNRNGCYE